MMEELNWINEVGTASEFIDYLKAAPTKKIKKMGMVFNKASQRLCEKTAIAMFNHGARPKETLDLGLATECRYYFHTITNPETNELTFMTILQKGKGTYVALADEPIEHDDDKFLSKIKGFVTYDYLEEKGMLEV